VTDEPAETRGPDSADADEVARRAYAIFLERGQADGRDVEDWLAAEQEILRRSPQLAPADVHRLPVPLTSAVAPRSKTVRA
jgi:hypothetical protein